MTDKPGVTVVITNYNHGEFLRAAVDSAVAQRHPAERVIVVDDGSTDDTESVLADLPPTVEVLRQHNQGVVAARNRALGLVDTKFVVFLDADDTLDPDFLRVTLGVWRRSWSKPAVVYTPARLTGIASGYSHTRAFDPVTLAQANYVPSTALLLTEAVRDVGGYAPEMAEVTHEDYDLYLSLVERGWRFKACPRPLFTYRVAGVSHNKSANHEQVRDTLTERHSWITTANGRGRGWQKVRRIVTELRQRRHRR